MNRAQTLLRSPSDREVADTRRWGAHDYEVIRPDGVTYDVHADRVEVTANGDLMFIGGYRPAPAHGNPDPGPLQSLLTTVIAAGRWTECHHSDVGDGLPVAISSICPPEEEDE